FFMHTPEISRVDIDKVLILSPKIGGKFTFYQQEKSSFVYEANVSYLFPGKTNYYEVKNGHSLGTSLTYSQETNAQHKYDFKLTYEQTDQNNSYSTKREKKLSFNFYYKWGNHL